MSSPHSPRRPTQEEQFEAQARALQADGYNGGGGARRMLEQHGMEEETALALVGRPDGKLARLIAGLGGMVVLFNLVGLSRLTT
jgi:hypothetical protein